MDCSSDKGFKNDGVLTRDAFAKCSGFDNGGS